jgi:DNA-binding Lrp family transcriptional regulator
MLTPLHKRLLNDFQRDFPLSPRPYQNIADALGVSENDVLLALTELNDNNFISRIGPIIPPNHIGVSTLVAMAVPEQQLQAIADIISAYPEVNHNYEREHRFNLWFVAIAADAGHLQSVLDTIEQETGYKTLSLPLLDDFFIDLGFNLDLRNA